MQTLKIRLGAVLALIFAALFYVSAVVAAAGLAWAAWEVGGFIPHARGKAIIVVGIGALALVAAALVVLWSILPRPSQFVAPGPELDREKHPTLFAEIDRIGAVTGQAIPAHVYLLPEVNAFVTERGGVMGFFSTRVMGIGLPLLSNLTVAQLRSVLAHEYGHFAGGDVKLLPWINKARVAMLSTLHNLSSAGESANQGELAIASIIFWMVRAPFKAFAVAYLRLTQGLSRAQEIAADALAISVCGSQTHADALQLTERAGLAFRTFLNHDVEPLLAAGKVPPLAAGFQRFLSATEVKAALDASAREERTVDPYDSHPPLEERVAFAQRCAVRVPPRPNDHEPAVNLLTDLAAAELELVQFVTELEALQLTSWDESGRHLVELWRKELASSPPLLNGLTVAQLPRTGKEVRLLESARLRDADDASALRLATRLSFLHLSVLLTEAGFLAKNQPGENVLFVRGEQSIDLANALRTFHAREGTRTAWVETWAALGLADSLLPIASTSTTANAASDDVGSSEAVSVS